MIFFKTAEQMREYSYGWLNQYALYESFMASLIGLEMNRVASIGSRVASLPVDSVFNNRFDWNMASSVLSGLLSQLRGQGYLVYIDSDRNIIIDWNERKGREEI